MSVEGVGLIARLCAFEVHGRRLALGAARRAARESAMSCEDAEGCAERTHGLGGPRSVAAECMARAGFVPVESRGRGPDEAEPSRLSATPSLEALLVDRAGRPAVGPYRRPPSNGKPCVLHSKTEARP